MAFFDSIDKKEIPQSQLDIDIKVRSNLFSWNGQFSPQFIESLLLKYSYLGCVIYDPFCGSGTTLCEAARKGLVSYGTELNPAAFYMAKCYELCNYKDNERSNLVQTIDRLIDSIQQDEIIERIIDKIFNSDNEQLKDVLSLLVVLLDLYNNELTFDLLKGKWIKLRNIIMDLPYSPQQVRVEMSDARHTNYADNLMDLVITSPPYINVFNYHQKYRKSVEALGFDVLHIAKKEFGSNRRNRGNRLLTVIEYCIDMALAIQEISRVSKENARFILVVGRESNVLGYSFCNSELIYRICTEIFKFPFSLRQERKFQNRYGEIIFEDILHFFNAKDYSNRLDEEKIICSARAIAVNALEEKRLIINEKDENYSLLDDAICRSQKVSKSEEE